MHFFFSLQKTLNLDPKLKQGSQLSAKNPSHRITLRAKNLHVPRSTTLEKLLGTLCRAKVIIVEMQTQLPVFAHSEESQKTKQK